MRSLALKGALPQFLNGEYQAGINLLDLTDPEYQYLRRFQRFQGGAAVGAVAAQYSYVAIGRNGSSRDMIAVVEKIVIANIGAANQQFYIYLTGNPLFGPGSGLNLPTDDRSPSNSGFTIGTFNSATDISSALFGVCRVCLNVYQTITLDTPYILTNALTGGNLSLLYVQTQALNSPLAVTFYWRERAVVAGEVR
jgi:hypothetical protein